MTVARFIVTAVLVWISCLALGIGLLEVTHRRHARRLLAAQDQAIALAMTRHPASRPAPEDDPIVMARISAQARRNA